MWKIGPEWAAQQAKLASDRIQKTDVFSACASVMSAGLDAAADEATAGPRPAAGAGRSSNEAGTMTAQPIKPSTSIAKRQSCATISQRASGAITVVPKASPAETRETARLRWRTNQLAVAAVNGT